MSFFSIPLSGLVASQDQLQSVSNNLANLDTVAYKEQNVSFADLFAQNVGSNGAQDPIQQGAGVTISATTSNFSDGTPTPTNIAANMALSGNGFFVVQQPGGAQAYSRAGDFTQNPAGFLVSPSGALVMGYPAQNGVVNTSGAIQPIQILSGTVVPGKATTTFNLPTNLNADTAVGAPAFNSPLNIYDSLGNIHIMNVSFTKTAANTWSYTVNVPTADTGAGSSVVASGNLTFDSSGALTSPTGTIPNISIPALTDGAAPMSLTWNLNNSNGAPSITQTGTASASSGTQDGVQSGTLNNFAIEADGTVNGIFTNGTTVALGQVALANFANTQGLVALGHNLYQQSPGSGQASVGVAGTGGRGTITGGSIEGSNVDTATEFAKMIVAQQAYQANAKTVTTFDQISQATIQMITQ